MVWDHRDFLYFKYILERGFCMLRNKRIIAVCLAIMFTLVSSSAYAAELPNNQVLTEKRIDDILGQISQASNELKMLAAKTRESGLSTARSEDISTKILSTEREIVALEAELTELGVKKLDPDNAADMERLTAVVFGNNTSRNISTMQTSTDPDFSDLAELYTIYETQSTYTIDGEDYDVIALNVIDNKSGGGLTHNESHTHELFGLAYDEETTVGALLDYTFSYGVDQIVGSIPNAWLAEWSIGSVDAVFDSFEDNDRVVASSDENDDVLAVYITSFFSITSMTYYYIYLPGMQSWTDCGSRISTVQLGRADVVQANVAGRLANGAETFSGLSSFYETAEWFATTYIEDGYAPEIAFGAIEVVREDYDGFEVLVEYTPPYVSYILDLM